MEDEALEEGEAASRSHGPLRVDNCRNVGREEGRLWRVEVLNGGFSPDFDPGRRSMLPLPVVYALSPESVPEEDGRRVLGRDEEVEGRRSGTTTSMEADSADPEAFV